MVVGVCVRVVGGGGGAAEASNDDDDGDDDADADVGKISLRCSENLFVRFRYLLFVR